LVTEEIFMDSGLAGDLDGLIACSPVGMLDG
jgi:hypothetical protein